MSIWKNLYLWAGKYTSTQGYGTNTPKVFPQGRPQGHPHGHPQGRPQGRPKVAVEQRGKPSGLVNFQSYKTIFIVFPLWECFWIYIFSKIWRINTLDMVKLSKHL